MKKAISKMVSVVAILLCFIICISSFGTAIAIKGDFDRSNALTAQDAIYLLYHTLYGKEQYPLYYDGDMNQDGNVDSDDAVYLLYSVVFGESEYPLPEQKKLYSTVTLHNNGISSYDMITGSDLPIPDDIIDTSLNRHGFIGWYDKSLSVKHTTVAESDMELYAEYRNCKVYSFDSGVVYDPNNRKLISAVEDPFGGSGKVLHTRVIRLNDTVYYGYYRGFAPPVHDGISGAGFEFKKGHTYEVTFSYRYKENTPHDASTTVSVYAADPQGVHKDGYKTSVTATAINSSSLNLVNTNDWNTCSFSVKNTTNYKHMYIRMMGSSSTEVYDLYIDNLVIVDTTAGVDSQVQLFNNGDMEYLDLKAGDTLSTLDPYYDDILKKNCSFIGWFDESLTTRYTTVTQGVSKYYAKYEYITKLTYEFGGMFDPNNKYKPTNMGTIASWYRELDPMNQNNICLRSDISNNGNTTHAAFSNTEGSSLGYKITEGKKYIVSFDYYLDSRTVDSVDVSFRGSTQSNIGIAGGKTNAFTSVTLDSANVWNKTACLFTAEEIAESQYLIMLAQGDALVSDVKIYFDNIVIRELPSNYDIVIATPAENLTFNDNGSITKVEKSYIGASLPNPKTYYGATSLGWYNDLLNVPYLTVPESNFNFFAKYDGTVLNFENGGIYNSNGMSGSNLINYSYSIDPTNNQNTVVKSILPVKEWTQFAFNASGYSTDGYKLKPGYTYTISFMYYAENLNDKNINVQFKGTNRENIGLSDGKSNSYGGMILTKEGEWTGVTVSFTYNGTELDSDEHYLIMLAQDGAIENATATIYFDDIVIKETSPNQTYQRKSVKIGGWTLGQMLGTQNIVIPSANFSYLAMMQCEDMINVIENIGSANFLQGKTSIVKDNSWSKNSRHFNIFIGNVNVNSSDSQYKIDTSDFGKDDYAYCIGDKSIYVDAGSTYALAMAVSELTKHLEGLPDGSSLATGTYVSGKYSEKIDNYSTIDYYRPTFIEDFDQDDIDTTIWSEIDGMEIASVTEGKTSLRSDEHTYIKDGNLVIEAAFDNDHYYGGMLKSHGKMEYRYGYLEISCITPDGAGIWTSLWAQSDRSSGLWGSEIDINESFGDARYSSFNMHSWPTSAGKSFGYTHYALDNKYATDKKADAGQGKTFGDGYHTFGYLWTTEGAKFIVDGQVYFEYKYDTSNTTSYYNDVDAFNEKLSLIISMTVGNPAHSGQFSLDETADYWRTTNKYIIDYIHIYQIDGQEIYFYDSPKE